MLIIAIVISGIIAHALGEVQYSSVFHERKIADLLYDYDKPD